MASLNERIHEISTAIQHLSAQQSSMNKSLIALINELEVLKKQAAAAGFSESEEQSRKITKEEESNVPGLTKVNTPIADSWINKKTSVEIDVLSKELGNLAPSNSLEEFVGKNLASKIGILITLHKKLTTTGKNTLILCNVSPQLVQLLKITRLDRVFIIKATRQDAVASR